MHVIVNRNALLEVLGIASSIASSRTTKDILKCVRLSATGDNLVISATDLEVGMRVDVLQVEVKAKGEALVPADKLMQIARESLDETFAIETKEEVCHIRGQDSHFEIFGQDPKEFPPVPGLEGKPDVEIKAENLRLLVERTLFAVAKENTRYAINGVLWEKLGKKLALVSTDGRRLARAVGTAEQSVGDDGQMIVPAKTTQMLQRALGTSDDKVQIKFSSNQVVVQCGRYVLSSALVEGHFPHYDEVIPKDNDKKIEMDVEDLLSGVKRAALLTNEQSKGVRMAFTKEKLVLSSRAPEQGEATVSLPIQYNGPDITIGFNPAFLVDVLGRVGVPSISFELKDANRPGLIKAGNEFTYVIMPVSL